MCFIHISRVSRNISKKRVRVDFVTAGQLCSGKAREAFVDRQDFWIRVGSWCSLSISQAHYDASGISNHGISDKAQCDEGPTDLFI